MQTAGGGPSSGREKAYAFIVDQVLTLPTTTGSFLNEQELAAQIGVSRTPVREALLLLQAEGLVEMVPKRGAQVPPLSGRQIAELMDLRGVLERHAAARVLTAGNAPVAAMRTILAEQEALVDSADESAAKTNLTRLRGRARRGRRLHAQAPAGHWRTTTMISSIRFDGSTACLILSVGADRALPRARGPPVLGACTIRSVPCATSRSAMSRANAPRPPSRAWGSASARRRRDRSRPSTSPRSAWCCRAPSR